MFSCICWVVMLPRSGSYENVSYLYAINPKVKMLSEVLRAKLISDSGAKVRAW